MSSYPSEEASGGKRVRDEEGTVDQKLKDRIIRARTRVDEREDAIYVQAPLEGAGLTQPQSVQIWGTSVRQYLRAVEPLLRSDQIAVSDYYYHEVEIADETLRPPDGTYPKDGGPMADVVEPAEYYWSLFYSEMPQRQAIDSHDHSLFTRGFEPPEPERVQIRGLRDVIEQEQVSASWSITVNPDAPQTERVTFQPSIRFPLRREWLRDAVRYTDEFLQECGISIDVGFEEIDSKETEPV